MKAAFFEETGAPEVLKVGELPDPKPEEKQILVRVKATTVNPIDTYIRAGKVPLALPMPFIPGCDVAGVVEATGSLATRFKKGDRVWGSNQGLAGRQGASAEFVCAEEDWFYPTPEGVKDEEAAALSLVAITAWLGLFHKGELKKGETVFVNGGTGGVGSAVVQIAKAARATVIATAGTPEKVRMCKKLGADHAIHYKSENVAEKVREYAPNGVNLWYETLGEPDLMMSVPLLAMGGRMILMAGRAATPMLPMGSFYPRDCKLLGMAVFNAPPAAQRPAAMEINRLMVEGKLKAQIGRVMKLDEIAAAHRLQEENTIGKAGTLTGKIVIGI